LNTDAAVVTQPKNKKHHFYNDLKRRILTMELAPGCDMDEVALSKEYQISRTPLRDVLRTLAGEGYLEIRDNRGAKVSSMDQKTLREFFQVAPMVYAAVSRLAAQNCTDKQIEELEQIQQRFMTAIETDNVDDKVYFNDKFHSLIGEMADNAFLLPSLRRLLIDHARISQTFYRPANEKMLNAVKTAAHHHDLMIQAFRDRDQESAARLAIEHWELSRQQIEAFVMPDSLEIGLGE
jgi:DNA-binding GntR family transcriptional regulator